MGADAWGILAGASPGADGGAALSLPALAELSELVAEVSLELDVVLGAE